MTLVSVIVCTHNPRQDYLQRVLEALRAQTLPRHKWELLVIDNASDRVLAKEWDMSWHPQSRHVREDELGVTPARLRGIAGANGELLVFVDDDNLLEQDYLETALEIAQEYPFLGAWGGTIRGEFEIEPEEWTWELLSCLPLREWPGPIWTNNPGEIMTQPSGAGLCFRRAVAAEYTRQVSADPRRRRLGRVGDTGAFLAAAGAKAHRKIQATGEDNDLIETSCDLGMGFGNFPSLILTHLIPKQRLQPEYLIRLRQSCTLTSVMLQYFRSGKVPPEPRRLRVTARLLLTYLTRGRHQARIYIAETEAVRLGIRAVHELPARPDAVPVANNLELLPPRWRVCSNAC